MRISLIALMFFTVLCSSSLSVDEIPPLSLYINQTTLVQCESSTCPNVTNCSNAAKINGECCERCFDSQSKTNLPL